MPVGKIDVPAAARWVSEQLHDGSHVVDEGSETPNYFLTTEAAYALAAAGGKSPALDKMVAELASGATEYAYPAGPEEAPDAAAAARLALVAAVTEGDPRAFGGRDLLGDLEKNVCASGPHRGARRRATSGAPRTATGRRWPCWRCCAAGWCRRPIR